MMGQSLSRTPSHDGSHSTLPLCGPDADFKILPSEAPTISPAWVGVPPSPTSHHTQLSPLPGCPSKGAPHQPQGHQNAGGMQEQQQGGNHCLRVMTHFDVESSSSVHNVMMPQHQAPQVGHIHRRLGIANICHF